ACWRVLFHLVGAGPRPAPTDVRWVLSDYGCQLNGPASFCTLEGTSLVASTSRNRVGAQPTVSVRSWSLTAFQAATTSTVFFTGVPLSWVPVSKIWVPLRRSMNVSTGTVLSVLKKLFSA